MYSWCHKIHHEFTAPIALGAIYCPPLEMVLSNLMPFSVGCLMLTRPHILTVLIWVVSAVLGTQQHHSGMRMPWVPFFEHQPNYHDFHHQEYNYCLGVVGGLDWLHGTDGRFRREDRELASLAAAARAELAAVEGAGAMAAEDVAACRRRLSSIRRWPNGHALQRAQNTVAAVFDGRRPTGAD